MKIIRLGLIFLITFCCVSSFGQRKKKNYNKMNWLEQKNAVENRLRFAAGFHAGEPLGGHFQLYKVRDICTSGITVNKKYAADISLSTEGTVFKNSLAKSNATWQSGGARFGLDIKYYAPFILNPYLGLGYEGGTRNFSGTKSYHSDFVAKLGGEQKTVGFHLSRHNSMIIRLFLEGKYNYCFSEDFNYLVAVFGLKFHII